MDSGVTAEISSTLSLLIEAFAVPLKSYLACVSPVISRASRPTARYVCYQPLEALAGTLSSLATDMRRQFPTSSPAARSMSDWPFLHRRSTDIRRLSISLEPCLPIQEMEGSPL